MVAVCAEARAIERHSDDIAVEPVFDHTRDDVRMMVLHADLLDAFHRQGESGAEVGRGAGRRPPRRETRERAS